MTPIFPNAQCRPMQVYQYGDLAVRTEMPQMWPFCTFFGIDGHKEKPFIKIRECIERGPSARTPLMLYLLIPYLDSL